MELAIIAAVAVALGVDAFSVSLAIGLCGICNRAMVVRLSLIVASFHVFMPLIGLAAGEGLGHAMGGAASLLGALIMMVLGGKMIWQAAHPKPWVCSLREARKELSVGRLPEGISLTGIGPYALAAGVSMDALSVGFSLGTMGTAIPLTVGITGVTAGLMTGAGLILGKVVKTRVSGKAEWVAGSVLVLIGISLLFK